jgi:acetate---CoA ligase (ADP-forming)
MTRELDYIFKPRAIAVVGASREPGSFGHRVVRYLVEGGYQGPLYPVNPKAAVIHSLPCYPRVEDTPDPVDLAVIAVPAKDVVRAVEQCADKGVRGVAVISADFSEAGPEGERRERELVTVVRQRGLRLLGPNCMGIVNTDPKVMMNATFVPVSMRPGRLAFMSQSGAMGAAILNYAADQGLAFSSFVSVGNRADLSVNDLLEYWKDDPRTDAILLYMENFGNPARFTQIARAITPGKPIIAVKSGRSASFFRPAFRDPDKIYGSEARMEKDVAVDALFEQCGVLRVETLEELFDLARAVICQPMPERDTVAVLTNGIGPAIMAVDALESMGLDVPPLDPRTGEELTLLLPPHAGVRNPVDIRTDAEPAYYGEAIGPLLDDPNIDALLVIYVGLDYRAVAEVIGAHASGAIKPVLVCLMGGRHDDPGITLLQEAGIPVYAFPESACRVLLRMRRYRRYKQRPPAKIRRARGVKREAVAARIAQARQEGRTRLSLAEVRAVAAAYGVKVPREGMARNEDEAATVASQIGFPVVVKVPPGRIRKKSDVGGLALDLRTDREVRRAFREVIGSVRERYPSARVEELLVQQMLKGGQELIFAASHDPVFGPVLKIGAGGAPAEFFQDFQLRIVPISLQDALEMVQALKIYPLLAGVRGRSPIHLPSLLDLLCRASQLLEEFPEIREFEINPLIASPRRKELWAVDGKLSLFEPDESMDAGSTKG